MDVVKSKPEMKIVIAKQHRDAPFFKAHNTIDERWKKTKKLDLRLYTSEHLENRKI